MPTLCILADAANRSLGIKAAAVAAIALFFKKVLRDDVILLEIYNLVEFSSYL
jgi:hypothetical protein